ncbi:glycosyltransferase family 4 protein [Piscinibacter sp. SJAQ100]|uniref:Glycosyltransferase family 4 protein n=2 Tax=Aquariibacter albus TaxID=2759899 RepID=A0A839HNV8_9BURK|nr:glycosyltransferase family 4 protein [Aquariibacter albus]
MLALGIALKQRGHAVCCAVPGGSWLAGQCEAAGLQVEILRMAGLYDLAALFKLRRLIRQWQADIVHAHLVRASQYAGWAVRGLPAVAVSTVHATNVHKHMRRAKRLIAVSDAVRQNLLRQGHDPSRVITVHNGQSFTPPGPRDALRTELGLPSDAFVLLSAGRFVHAKGQDLMIEALKRCPHPVHLVLVGDHRSGYGQEQLAQAGERVHFLGYRPDVGRLLGVADAYLCASRREAISLSVIEAAAAGLPVIATAVGGIPEVIEDGVQGRLVPPENADALASAICELVANRAVGERWGRAGRQRYEERFTLDHMIDGTEAVYAQALAARA